jgi:hypothetical protein
MEWQLCPIRFGSTGQRRTSLIDMVTDRSASVLFAPTVPVVAGVATITFPKNPPHVARAPASIALTQFAQMLGVLFARHKGRCYGRLRLHQGADGWWPMRRLRVAKVPNEFTMCSVGPTAGSPRASGRRLILVAGPGGSNWNRRVCICGFVGWRNSPLFSSHTQLSDAKSSGGPTVQMAMDSFHRVP